MLHRLYISVHTSGLIHSLNFINDSVLEAGVYVMSDKLEDYHHVES
jgi:hypothetical protein